LSLWCVSARRPGRRIATSDFPRDLLPPRHPLSLRGAGSCHGDRHERATTPATPTVLRTATGTGFGRRPGGRCSRFPCGYRRCPTPRPDRPPRDR